MSSGAINQAGVAGAGAPGSLAAALGAPLSASSGEPRHYGVITHTGLVQAAILGVLMIVLFHHFLWSQHLFSWGSGDWSHAYMVPLISLYILWQRRAELAKAPAYTFWPGLVPLLVAIPIYAFSQVRAVPGTHMIQGWSMILCLFGLVLLMAGPVVARIAFIPILYLLLGITISEQIMIKITFQLQLIAAQGAWMLLNLIGVSTDIEGNVLNVHAKGGVHPLNVAEACSGMRMVIAFLALGVAVAVVGVRLWWQRVLLVMLAVPVALFMNVIRVAVLGVLTLIDPQLATGESHMLIGTLLLVPAFLLYMLVVWCLHKLVPDDAPKPPKLPGRVPGVVRWDRLSRPAFITAASALLLGTVGVTAVLAIMDVHLRKMPIQPFGDRKVHAVPAETASWIRLGGDEKHSVEMIEELGTSNVLSRNYVRKNLQPGDRQVRLSLHLAYYTGMIDTVPHVPERCMTGGGWTLASTPTIIPLPLDTSRWTPERDAEGKDTGRWRVRIDRQFTGDPERAPERVRLPRDPRSIAMLCSEFTGPRGGRMFGGYFFIANGGHVPRAEDVRLLAFDLQSTYAFYLKVQVTSPDALDKEDLAKQSASLLSELLPEIMRCVPDWTEVEAGRYPPDNPARAKAAGATTP